MYFMSSSFRVVAEVMGVYIIYNVLLQNQRQTREVKPSQVLNSQTVKTNPIGFCIKH